MKYDIILENWNTFIKEEQVPTQPAQIDGSKPQEVTKLLTPYINKSQGELGPDKSSLKVINSEKGQQILSALKISKNPIDTAKLFVSLFSLLSDEDKAEIATKAAKITQAAQKQPIATPATPAKITEATPIITQTRGSTNTTTAKPIITQTKGSTSTTKPAAPTASTPAKPAEPAKELATNKINDFAIKGLTNLGGGDPLKGMKILAGGPFIVGMAMALADIASGQHAKGVTDIANNVYGLFRTMNTDDLGKILDLQMDAMTESIEITEHELQDATLDDGTPVCPACLMEILELTDGILFEAKYHGRTVTLNKPMKGDVKKSKVFVKDPKTGNIKKVNFGDKNMKIKKNIPARRKSFRARHHCENPGPKTKARYWSCKAWE